jgi:cellulose synthase operon protein C
LKADPKNPFALNNLAWILAARPAAATEALALVERAIALGGADGEILDTRARILIAAGQLDRAVAELSMETGSGGTLRFFHLALAYERMGKHAEAIKAFREAQAHGLDARAIHPDDAAVYRALAATAGPS